MIIEKHKQLNPNPEGVTLCKLQPYKHIKARCAGNTKRQQYFNPKGTKGIATQRTGKHAALR
jgi:hypothetical protein